MFLYNDIRGTYIYCVTSTIEVSGVERSVLLIATNWRDIRPTVGRKHILMLGHCLRCFSNISPTMALTIFYKKTLATISTGIVARTVGQRYRRWADIDLTMVSQVLSYYYANEKTFKK